MELALALQYMKFHQEDHHTQKEQDLWTVNWTLQSHKTRASHVAPVRQIKDSEQEVSTKPAQKEGLISPKDTAMSVGSVKAEQVSKPGCQWSSPMSEGSSPGPSLWWDAYSSGLTPGG